MWSTMMDTRKWVSCLGPVLNIWFRLGSELGLPFPPKNASNFKESRTWRTFTTDHGCFHLTQDWSVQPVSENFSAARLEPHFVLLCNSVLWWQVRVHNSYRTVLNCDTCYGTGFMLGGVLINQKKTYIVPQNTYRLNFFLTCVLRCSVCFTLII